MPFAKRAASLSSLAPKSLEELEVRFDLTHGSLFKPESKSVRLGHKTLFCTRAFTVQLHFWSNCRCLLMPRDTWEADYIVPDTFRGAAQSPLP